MMDVRKTATASTASRQSILDRIRSTVIDAETPQPVDPSRLIRFDDPLAHFQETLRGVGGQPHLVDDTAQILDILGQIDVFADAQRIASTVPGIDSTIPLDHIDDPHSLSALDWTIVRGEFAVAENGAIWIDGQTLPHRVLIFIAQYLAIVVSRRQIVDQMHQAYARVGKPEPGFGIFVSGPSKTADIEQSLVLGAHGCRKLQVFLLP